jgi:CHASE3 domain sensor protein
MRGQGRLVAAVVAAVTVGATAVAFGVALLLGDIVHLRATATDTLRTGDYLSATINVERTVVDAETGLRGYVITGEEQFLAPTQKAEAQLPPRWLTHCKRRPSARAPFRGTTWRS